MVDTVALEATGASVTNSVAPCRFDPGRPHHQTNELHLVRQRKYFCLTGEGATKGVFVTTSDFSKEARDYLGKVQHCVVLINGQRLAQLVIRHGVGVRTRITHAIKGIDEDYFSDMNAG